VGIGDSPQRVRAVLGRPGHSGGNDPVVPLDHDFLSEGFQAANLEAVSQPDGHALRYGDAIFVTCKRRSRCRRTIGAFVVTADGARTSRGVAIGQSINRAKQSYRLHCEDTGGGESATIVYCSGPLSAERYISFSGEKGLFGSPNIASIAVSLASAD